MKKSFPCGHKGLGQRCARCAQAEALRQKATKVKTAQEREALLHEAKRLQGQGRGETWQEKNDRLDREEQIRAKQRLNRDLANDPVVIKMHYDDIYGPSREPDPDWREIQFGDIRSRGGNH